MFSCENFKIFKNIYFEKHLPTAASVLLIKNLICIGHLPTFSFESKTLCGVVSTKKVCSSGHGMFFRHLLVETILKRFCWLISRKQKSVQSKKLQQRLFVWVSLCHFRQVFVHYLMSQILMICKKIGGYIY